MLIKYNNPDKLSIYINDIKSSQCFTDLCAWVCFINEYKIKTIVELGTGSGGFTSFLEHYCTVYTFDQNKPVINLRNFEQLDIKENVDKIKAHASHADLIFCDGGDKPWEVDTFFNSFLYMAAHDWHDEILSVPGKIIKETQHTVWTLGKN